MTAKEIDDILEIIRTHHLAYVGQYVGVDVLTDDQIQLLIDLGIDISQITPTEVAFHFGLLSSTLDKIKAKNLTLTQLKKMTAKNKSVPLSDREKFALQSIKRSMFAEITGLGNKVGVDFQRVAIEADVKQRAEYEKLIQHEVTVGVANRASQRHVVSEIGHRTGDWARDLARIVDYNLHAAFDMGRAMKVLRDSGPNGKVYKDVYAGACRHCIRLYLTNGIGSEPKIFNVADLVANGTNIGKKSDQFLAVIGPTHPWCRCTLYEVPANFEWDPKTKSFSRAKNWSRSVQRKSKVKVTVGDKKIDV